MYIFLIKAEDCYKRVIDIYEINSYKLDKLNTKNELASTYLKHGKYKETEFLLKEVINNASEVLLENEDIKKVG